MTLNPAHVLALRLVRGRVTDFHVFFLETNMINLSATNVRISKPVPLDLIGGLRKLLDSFDSDVDLHDRADAVIEACIWQGIATRSEIIAMTDRLGFTRANIRSGWKR